MSTTTGSFTRGSQLFLHTLRMMAQGTKAALITSLVLSTLWLSFRVHTKIYWWGLYYWLYERWATVKMAIGEIFYHPSQIIIGVYRVDLHKTITLPCWKFKQTFWTSYSGRNIDAVWSWICSDALFELVIVFCVGLCVCYGFFVLRGRKSMGEKTTRGGEIVEVKALKKKLNKEKQASDLTIGELPLVKDSERQHILISGTTGSGKTNLLHELIPQIRKRGDKAIIVDLNGALIGAHFKQGDLLLNPFDQRSEHWTPWADAQRPYEYDAMANSIFGQTSLHDPFWDNSAKTLLSAALEKKGKQKKKSINHLVELFLKKPPKKYSAFFQGTYAANLTHEDLDKTLHSIRANTTRALKSLMYLKATKTPFSIKDYIKQEGQKEWLFMTATPTQRQTLAPLLSTWLNVALNGIMEREVGQEHKNIWIIIDELPSLTKIPSLKTALAESRKYGGCIVGGIQNIHQILDIYQEKEGANILDQFNTRFVFRVGDQKTASLSSLMLGEKQTKEIKESFSYGAHAMRDGVNLNTVERKDALVLPTEIMTLPSLHCYAKLEGSWPITKVKMKFHKKKMKIEFFVHKPEKEQARDQASNSPSGKAEEKKTSSENHDDQTEI